MSPVVMNVMDNCRHILRNLLSLYCIVILLNVESVHARVDYCSYNTFNSSSSWLQFTKEISSKEYSISSTFKSLHCCAKGYRSIEWYKDGRPYPWPGGVSNFILYPESANQTVYSQNVLESDGGNYSCLVRNDTAEYWHFITLTVIEPTGYSGRPLTTYKPQDQVVQLGQDARFFCEAFVGHIKLPDAHSAIIWRRDNKTSFHHHLGVSQCESSRENKQILGSYLFIRGVRREDLGQYVCRITNLDTETLDMTVWLRQTEILPQMEPARTASRRMLLTLVLVVLSGLTIVVLYLRFGLQLRLFCRDSLCRPDRDDGKQYDALLCYEEHDAEFVLGVLLPSLEHRYNYRCAVHCLPSHDNRALWSTELAGPSERSRRLVAVLSPSLLGQKWNSSTLHSVLNVLYSLHPAVVSITLKPLPKCEVIKDEQGHSLPQLLRQSPPVEWTGPTEVDRKQFWTALRLRLPPRDRQNTQQDTTGTKQQMTQISVPGGTKKRTLRSNSHESLEVLV